MARRIGQYIADAMQKVGNEGVITVEEAKAAETELEVVKGMQPCNRWLARLLRMLVTGSIVVGKILECNTDNFGYNAQTGEFGDMIAMGIVDPVKVVRTAMQNAASVAGLLVTTEAMIADLPKKDATGGGMPDMSGMGGMM